MTVDREEVYARFSYHQPSTEDVRVRHEYIRSVCGNLAGMLMTTCPESRELTLALTNLDQVCMYANAAVARHQ